MNIPSRNPLVSIIIVTWNRKQDVLVTLQSIVDQNYREYEVIVIDNGSEDGTVEAVEAQYPEVQVIALDENLGPSGGRNVGVNHAEGEIIFFLDSDASVGKHTLANTVDKFQDDPELGVVACKVINAHTYNVGSQPQPGWIFTENNKVDQDEEFLSFSLSECGCAIYKPAFDEVGQFWERLFFGREGEELSIRIWDAGYKILYCPQSVVYHRISPDVRVGGGEREYFNLRNCLYTYFVRYPWWMLVQVAPLRIGASLVRGVRHRQLPQVGMAIVDFVQQLPSLWEQRHPIQDSTARKYMQMQREHGPLSWNLSSWIKYKS